MGGFFAVASKEDCVFDLFFGTDYHSHLGTRRAGLAVYGKKGFDRAIHNIENSPFRTKFESDVHKMEGSLGIGCISDYEPQPLIVRSHHGTFAITTVGKINNTDTLVDSVFGNGNSHFLEMSGGEINATELVAALINQKDNMVEGIKYAQEVIEGSMSILILTPKGIYAARDRMGRTPVAIGRKEGSYCASFESFAYLNLGYEPVRELGPGEIVVINPEAVVTVCNPGKKMKICTFLWVYYGYPSSSYEGISVEKMRYNCGSLLARRDDAKPDIVAGVPDSGTAHAIGYANESGIPFSRPFIKYTPTWPRSFMPTIQSKRNLIAKMKLIPVHDLIKDKSLLLIDDSIVRGTQLRETTEFLYKSGAREVHIRPACPPLVYGCKFLNFSRSTSEMDLITRRVIADKEGDNVSDEVLKEYCNPDSDRYDSMLEEIRKQLSFTSLRYHRLDDLIESVGIDKDNNLISYPKEMCMNMPVYLLTKPYSQVQIGDIVKINNSYAKVLKKNNNNSLSCLSFSGYTQNKKEIKDFMLGQSFVKVVVNMFSNIQTNGFNPMMLALADGNVDMKDFVLMQMMQSGDSNQVNPMLLMAMMNKDENNSMFESLLMMQMMNGQMNFPLMSNQNKE